MRLALLADVHANREALLACLDHAHAQGASDYAFLGDLVGYGADPAAVLDIVMDYQAAGAIVVQGNHDAAAADEGGPGMQAEAGVVLLWTRQQLSPAQRAWLAGLPTQVQRGPLCCVHASAWPGQRWEYVQGLDAAARCLQSVPASRLVACGHVHVPALYRRGPDGSMGLHRPAAGQRIPLDASHQYLAIGGACGQPRDGDARACYALWDSDAAQLSYFRVPYDHGAAARRVIGAGLPIVFAMRLIEGL